MIILKVLLRSKTTSRFSLQFESAYAEYSKCEILCNDLKRKTIYFKLDAMESDVIYSLT